MSPKLIDLLAAVATGVVGSVALARRDISETLPGVAIAISLVPPLTVVGLTLRAGEIDQSLGALLLFLTNVAAILATGTVVMALYGIHKEATRATTVRVNRRNAVAVIVALIIMVSVPLTAATVTIASDTNEQLDVQEAGRAWAATVGWELVEIHPSEDRTIARFEGPLPIPDIAAFRDALRAHGVEPGEVRAELLHRQTVDLADE